MSKQALTQLILLSLIIPVTVATAANKRGWNVEYDGEQSFTTLHRGIAMQGGWANWLEAKPVAFRFVAEHRTPQGSVALSHVGYATMDLRLDWPLLELELRGPQGARAWVTWDGQRVCREVVNTTPGAMLARMANRAAGVSLGSIVLPFTLLDRNASHHFVGREEMPHAQSVLPVSVLRSHLPDRSGMPFPDVIETAYDDDNGFLFRSRLRLLSEPDTRTVMVYKYETFTYFNFATDLWVYREPKVGERVPEFSMRITDLIWLEDVRITCPGPGGRR